MKEKNLKLGKMRLALRKELGIEKGGWIYVSEGFLNRIAATFPSDYLLLVSRLYALCLHHDRFDYDVRREVLTLYGEEGKAEIQRRGEKWWVISFYSNSSPACFLNSII